MSLLLRNIAGVLSLFPGEWRQEPASMVLRFPGGECKVGPSNNIAERVLSIDVYIILDEDPHNIAFHRGLHNDGTITTKGGTCLGRLSNNEGGESWLRHSLAEAMAFIKTVSEPEPNPPTRFAALFWGD